MLRSFRFTFVLAMLLLVLAGACHRKSALTSNLSVENKVAMRSVRLYFESPDMALVPETRNVPLPENEAGALAVVVRELFKGSANPSVPRPFPADAVVRGVFFLPDGTAFVDLGGPTLTQGWGTGSHEELMAVYSLVQTVTSDFAEVKRVRILVNGEPAETLAGHINLSKGLTPLPWLLTPSVGTAAPSVAVATPPAATSSAH